MTKRAITFAAGEVWPDYVEPFLLITILGKDVIHLTRTYPNEHASLCGRATRNNSYDRSPNVMEEFARKLCGDCAELAQSKVSA